MINYNSQIILYPGTVSEKGSRQSNARQDIMTLGELIRFLKLPAESGGGAVLSVPGNLGCDATTEQLPYLIAMAAAGFDMSRIKIQTLAEMPDNVNLSFSKFSGAIMARLIVNSTVSSDWSNSDLSSAVLAWSGLTRVLFDQCNMRFVVLEDAVITGCSMTGCDLTYSNLEGATLDTCDLSGSDLSNANLKDLIIGQGGGVDMTNCNLSGVEFLNTELDLSAIFLDGITADGMSAVGISFSGGFINQATIKNSNFNSATFSGSGIENSSLFKCSFVETTFNTGASLAGTTFETCDFTDATFTELSIAGASFLGCNFAGAGINDLFTLANLDGPGDGDSVTWVDGTVYEWNTDQWVEA